MAADSTLLGIYIALPVLGSFLLCHFKRRVIPDLGQASGVFLSAVALVVAVSFARRLLSTDLGCLAQLGDQRLPMFLGALATAWLAVSQLVKTYRAVLFGARRPPDEAVTP